MKIREVHFSAAMLLIATGILIYDLIAFHDYEARVKAEAMAAQGIFCDCELEELMIAEPVPMEWTDEPRGVIIPSDQRD